MTEKNWLTMQGIKKSFSGVTVLKDVSLEVNEGEIHALLGENGAGKSTLMNILGGVLRLNSGIIKINGKEVNMESPRVSQEHGVSFIHQELNVISDLRVYESIFLGSEIRNKIGLLNVEAMCKKTNEIMTSLGVGINPKEYVRNLDTSYKQLVEISKMLLHESKLIIMDEPTTALADHEVERLFTLMKRLKKSGVSIIYISHKLKEIQEVCDRYTVLRDGNVVGKGNIKDENLDTITQLMVGKAISNDRIVEQYISNNTRLEVKNLNSEGFFRDINFTVGKGEIVGFTGLAGDGRTELFETIFGYRKRYTGNIEINGKALKIKHPRHAIKSGIGFIPKDRKENAILKDLSCVHNMSISSLGHVEKVGFIDGKSEFNKFIEYKNKLNIKVYNPKVTIDKLSGGNQQKVVIAKWLEVDTDIVVFDNPTQGIDVGAKEEIYHHIIDLANKGKSIIILSSEAPEVLKICHEINVMYKGEIYARFKGNETSEDEIMNYATGSKDKRDDIKNEEVVKIG